MKGFAARNESSKATLLKATAANGLSRALALPLTMLISMWLARVLSREDFAFYGVLTTSAMFFAILAQFGFQTSVVRLLAEASGTGDARKRSTIFLTALLTTLVLGCAGAVLFAAYGGHLLPETAAATSFVIALAALQLVARSLNTCAAEAFRGLGRVALAANFSGMGLQGGVFRCLIMLAGLGALTLAGDMTLRSVLILSSLASLVCVAIAVAMILYQVGLRFSLGEAAALMRARYRSNFVYMSSEALQSATSVAAAMLIGGNALSATALAGVVSAFQVRSLLTGPLTLLNGAAPAVLIRLKQEGRDEELEELVRISASAALVIAVAAYVGVLAAGPWGFKLLFGASYGDAYWHFALMSLGVIFSVFSGMAGATLLMLGDARQHQRAMIGTTLFALPAYYLSSHYLGPYGLSASISAVGVVQNLLLLRAAGRNLGIKTYAYLTPGKYVLAFGFVRRRIAGVLRRKRATGDNL